MYHYQKNIGDYRSATMHLTLVEHGVYNQLLDWYYLDEAPLPADNRTLFRRLSARTEDEQKAVLDVLSEMFSLTESGWMHKRVEREISQHRDSSKLHRWSNIPKHILASINAGRKASKANATPKWLTKNQRSDIAAIYAEAATKTASTGVRHEVDHIVPIRSKVVCGLHVAWNLRVVTTYENRSKSNFFEVLK